MAVPHPPITINNTPMFLHSAYVGPAYGEKSVITTDIWEYVELWLRRMKCSTASWLQARAFYEVVPTLPTAAKPLLAYYFALNAATTLLDVKNVEYSAKHGVSGKTVGNKTSLGAEEITVHSNGVMGGLRDYFNVPSGNVNTDVKELFSALGYLHRNTKLYPV